MRTWRALLAAAAILSVGANTRADLCTDPIKAICEAPVPPERATADQIRSEALAGMGATRLTTLTGDASKDGDATVEYRKYLDQVSKALQTRFEKAGIKPADIDAQIEKIQASVVRNLQNGKIGAPIEPSGPKSNESWARYVRGTKFLSRPETAEDAEFFYEWCGVDGMTSQAVYTTSKNTFILCPGFLLYALNTGSLDSLNFIVGHELSHAVDGSFRTNRAPKYRDYLDCVQKRHASRFETVEHVNEELWVPAQIRLQKHLAKLRELPGDHSAEILDAEDHTRIAMNQMKEFAELRETLKGILGREPTVAEMHSRELTADLGAYETILSLLRETPPSKRAGAIIATMRDSCEGTRNPAKVAKYGPLTDDSIHPPSSFRLESLLNHPKMKLLLGCGELAGDGTSCAAGETSPIGARCTRVKGFSSAGQCERLVGEKLKALGCKVSDLSCSTFDGVKSECLLGSENCKAAWRPKGSKQLACDAPEKPQLLESLGIGVCVSLSRDAAATPADGAGAEGAR